LPPELTEAKRDSDNSRRVLNPTVVTIHVIPTEYYNLCSHCFFRKWSTILRQLEYDSSFTVFGLCKRRDPFGESYYCLRNILNIFLPGVLSKCRSRPVLDDTHICNVHALGVDEFNVDEQTWYAFSPISSPPSGILSTIIHISAIKSTSPCIIAALPAHPHLHPPPHILPPTLLSDNTGHPRT
jgi:hypothetical protein